MTLAEPPAQAKTNAAGPEAPNQRIETRRTDEANRVETRVGARSVSMSPNAKRSTATTYWTNGTPTTVADIE